MHVAFASLELTNSWQGQEFVLVRATDAIRMRRQGVFEAVPRHRAEPFIGNFGGRELGTVRAFVGQLRLAGVSLASLEDAELVALLRSLVKSGELVVLRACEFAAGGEGDAPAEQRRLVREIDAKTRGRLADAGRQYRLVAGDDLGKFPDRDSYEVVRQDDAKKVLAALGKKSGAGASDLAALLARASEKLTRDWRRPFHPEGVVLLRRIVIVSAKKPEVGPTLTPSALRKLRDEGWIEIKFVDADMEPIGDVDFDMRLADGQVKSGKTDKNGLARYEGIQPGECRVRFPKVKGPVVRV